RWRSSAGLPEQTDDAVADPAIAALRERTDAVADAQLARDEAFVDIHLASGRRLGQHVPHARGSRDRPMTDAEIDAKFMSLATTSIGGERAAQLLATCRALPGTGADWVPRLALQAA
ncbi:MAG: hypothetical protein EOO66_10090, partial [Methylobacterium sp.]